MKKALTIVAIISSTLFTSAQNLLFTVVVQIEDNPEYSMEKPNKNNVAFGYMVNEQFMAGITMADATTELKNVDGFENIIQTASEVQILCRYYHSKNLFAQVTSPWDSNAEGISASELLKLGGGYSVRVWDNLNIEASYSMLIKKDVNSDRKGSWYAGLSYRL